MPQKRVMNASVVTTTRPSLNCHSELLAGAGKLGLLDDDMVDHGAFLTIASKQVTLDFKVFMTGLFFERGARLEWPTRGLRGLAS